MRDHNDDTVPTSSLPFAASKLLASGCSIIPIRDLASKAPGLNAWKPFQFRKARPEEAIHWFTPNGLPAAPGMAIVCGEVSDGLTVLDFDLRQEGGTLFEAWAALVEELAPGLLGRLPVVATPSGGRHVYLRAPLCEHNTKLAESVPYATTNSAGVREPRRDTWIETRANGGYVLAPPTPGYKTIQGTITAIPTISVHEREVLLSAARSLSANVQDTGRRAVPGDLPGDAFNAATAAEDLAALLSRHGWAVSGRTPGCIKLRRPGKDQGLSATIRDGQGIPIFYCFSTSAVGVPVQRGASPFGVYAALEHGGDHAAAAAALARQGYGTRSTPAAGSRARQPAPPPAPERPAFNPWDHIKSLSSLMARQFAPATFVVPGVIPSGVTVIAGAPKTGKSLFGWGIALAVARGGYALGKVQVKRRRVLYLVLEDGERLVQKRVRRMLGGAAEPDNLDYCEIWPLLSDGGVEALGVYLDRYPDALVIIDTYESLRAPDKPGSNSYRNDYGGLAPLTKLAHQRNADVIIVHHTGKMERIDPLATVNGSYGLTGAVDNVAVLQRVRFGGECVLSVAGRDLDEDLQLALEFDPVSCSHILLGDAEDVGITRLQQLVLSVLKRAKTALQPKEIADLAGKPNDSSLRHLLGRMVDAGMAKIVGRGRYMAMGKEEAGAANVTCDIVTNDPGGEEMAGPPAEEGWEEEPDSEDHNVTMSQTPAGQAADVTLLAMAKRPCPSCGKHYHWKLASHDPQGALTCKWCGTEWRLEDARRTGL